MTFSDFKRRMTAFAVLLVVLLMVSFVMSCHKKLVVTNLPPGVSQTEVVNWFTATGVLKTIADTTDAAVPSIIQMNRTGVLPDGPAYVALMQSFARMGQAGLHAKTVLAQSPNQFGQGTSVQVTSDIQMISAQLLQAQSEGLTGIKDPKAQEQVKAWLLTVQTALNVYNTIKVASQ